MSRITVMGGTGYAGAAVVEQAAVRGHQVTVLSRTAPAARVPAVAYEQGDATNRHRTQVNLGNPARTS